MKVLIIEDEKPAAEKLISHLQHYDPDIDILDVLGSVKKSVEWFSNVKNKADLVFMDIQLTDGVSFDIFSAISVNTPILFTTAYDQYAIEAFKVNSIDYLLKPISYDKLYKSLEKFKNLKENILGANERVKYDEIDRLIERLKKDYKNRFMIRVGDHIRSITSDQIALFCAEGRNVSVVTRKMREYVINYKMEELEELLDPAVYFRINRTFIIHIDSITDVLVYSNSRLQIKLENEFNQELIVSRDKVNEFKFWFNGEV